MTTPTKPTQTISLDTDWTVEYFELEPDLYEWGPSAQSVEQLSSWRCTSRVDEGWGALLMTTFDLEMTEFCARYDLFIERAPGTVVLYINGRRMGEVDGSKPFTFDVTDYITLEDNRLGFRVHCADEGSFGTVKLLQFPCDS